MTTSVLRIPSPSLPLWFVAALAPMIVSEIVRLNQSDPMVWIAYDYLGRLAGLAVLAAVPAARAIAFRDEQCRVAWWEVTLWVIGLVIFDRIVDHSLTDQINAMLPGTRIGRVPAPHGWLFVVDTFVGLALVAYSEEVIFRRCGRALLRERFGDGATMIFLTAILFASYHWWTGVGNIAATLLFGITAMLFYRRAGRLSPIILVHYLCDVADFS